MRVRSLSIFMQSLRTHSFFVVFPSGFSTCFFPPVRLTGLLTWWLKSSRKCVRRSFWTFQRFRRKIKTASLLPHSICWSRPQGQPSIQGGEITQRHECWRLFAHRGPSLETNYHCRWFEPLSFSSTGSHCSRNNNKQKTFKNNMIALNIFTTFSKMLQHSSTDQFHLMCEKCDTKCGGLVCWIWRAVMLSCFRKWCTL